ncbi:hypothetical protein LMG33818_002582 [Halomonadaceae bacterium LMG 33818]
MSQKAKSSITVSQRILSGIIHLVLALSSAIAISTLAPGLWISVFVLSLVTAGIAEWYLKQRDSCAKTKC